jgi:putative flippase GtrA
MSTRTQFARYVIVGGLAFLVDYGCTALFLTWLPLLIANTLGFLIANIFNFLAAHRWVFGRSFAEAKIATTYAGVVVVSIVGLAINDAVVWIAIEIAHSSLLVAKIIATAMGLVWNFGARRTWIYREGSR